MTKLRVMDGSRLRLPAMSHAFPAPLAAVAALGLALVACREPPPPPPTPTEPPPAASVAPAAKAPAPAVLTRVSAASLVCMVNDRFMGSEQIPVTVGDRTYYGCCASCKAKLENDASARTGIDPVTRKSVDKAKAVIGKTDSGKVLYFESDETFARYTAGG